MIAEAMLDLGLLLTSQPKDDAAGRLPGAVELKAPAVWFVLLEDGDTAEGEELHQEWLQPKPKPGRSRCGVACIFSAYIYIKWMCKIVPQSSTCFSVFLIRLVKVYVKVMLHAKDLEDSWVGARACAPRVCPPPCISVAMKAPESIFDWNGLAC